MLVVEGLRQADRDAPEGALGRVEGCAAEGEQSAEGAARQHALPQPHRGHPVVVGDGEPGRVVEVVGGGQGIGRGTHHQGLAVADEDVVAAVAVHRGGHLHLLVELGDDLIALVEQVVGGLVGARRLHQEDACVQVGDLGRVGVDLAHHRDELGVDPVAHFVQALVQGLETACQGLGAGQQRLARGTRVGAGGHALHGTEEFLQRRGQAGARVGEQVVDLLDLAEIRVQLGAARLGAQYLVGEVLAVGPFDGDDARALPHRPGAGHHGLLGRLDDLLAAITGGGGIDDVVARGDEPGLRRVDPRYADAEDAAAHVLTPFLSLTARRAVSCVNPSARPAASLRR